MQGQKPVVKMGGGSQPIGDGDKISPRFLPTFKFPKGEFDVELGADSCGQPMYIFKHKETVLSGDDCTTACGESVVAVDVKVPVWVEGVTYEKGSVVAHCNAYYTAQADSKGVDPAMVGSKWSKAYCNYALAVKHAISDVNTSPLTPHLGREDVVEFVKEGLLQDNSFVTAIAVALVNSSSVVTIEDSFGNNEFKAFSNTVGG